MIIIAALPVCLLTVVTVRSVVSESTNRTQTAVLTAENQLLPWQLMPQYRALEEKKAMEGEIEMSSAQSLNSQQTLTFPRGPAKPSVVLSAPATPPPTPCLISNKAFITGPLRMR